MVRIRSHDDAQREISGSLLKLVAQLERSLHESTAEAGRIPDLGRLGQMAMRLVAEGLKIPRLASPAEWYRIFRKVLEADVTHSTRRYYSPGKPRVEPSPIDPGGLAATVLRVPPKEVEEFLQVVVRRYQRSLTQHWARAALESWRDRALAPLDDLEFTRIVTRTSFARLVTPRLDPADRRVFAGVLKKHGPRRKYYKVDLSALDRFDTFPGIFVTPTISLFGRDDSGSLRPLAIGMGDRVVEPGDGASWDYGKYAVTQGCALGLVVGIHPTVHFPMDAINACTKALLPRSHVVRRLLEPHLYMQLPLNYAVLYIDRSVAHNDQREIYTPFPGTQDGFFQFTTAYHRGIPGNSAYPSYRFPLGPPDIPLEYGEYIAAYYRVIEQFVAQVVERVKPDDRRLARWADEIARHVRGFPDGASIRENHNLVRALTTFITNVSVLHSADHHSFATIPVNKAPLRLRQPPPGPDHRGPLDRRKLIEWEDLFRHRMASEMYFKSSPVVKLEDAEYDFTQLSLRLAAERFHRALRVLDRNLPGPCFAPLDQLASSIQF